MMCKCARIVSATYVQHSCVLHSICCSRISRALHNLHCLAVFHEFCCCVVELDSVTSGLQESSCNRPCMRYAPAHPDNHERQATAASFAVAPVRCMQPM